jgi:predicted nucleic acid-binding protein
VGEQGNREGAGAEVVLDAGALIAFERGDRRIRAFAAKAADAQIAISIPATVLAQIWRGGSRSASVARLVSASKIDPLDETRAKEVGVRLGRQGKTDVADAHVVCCALDRDADLVTSDPRDMRALTESAENLAVVSV